MSFLGVEVRIATGAARPRNDTAARGATGGPMWASAPTEAQQEVQWAGDRKGRPYGGLQGVPCGRADRGVRPYG